MLLEMKDEPESLLTEEGGRCLSRVASVTPVVGKRNFPEQRENTAAVVSQSQGSGESCRECRWAYVF